MPIATNLDMNKDLNLCTPRRLTRSSWRSRSSNVGCPSRGCSGPTGRTATLLAAGYQGVRIDAGAPRAPGRLCLFSPFRRLHGPRGVVGESAASSWPRQRCIRPTVSLAEPGRLKGAHVTAGRVAFSAVFP
jgi:hypothetical protein